MKKFLIFTALILASAVPFFAHAAPLVPECVYSGAYCQACDLLGLANNLIQFAVQLAIAVATLMFAYAGFLYVTASANPNNLEKAKKIFGNVFLGLVLVLTAWLIVDLTLTVFTNKSLLERNIECVARAEVPSVPPASLTSDVGTKEEQALELQKREDLAERNVGINNTNACAPGQTTGCTTMAGVDNSVIEYLGDTDVMCTVSIGERCEIVVTGGSEGGHAGGTLPGSHGAGDKVDLRTTGSLNIYVLNQVDSGNFTKVSDPSFGSAQYVDNQTGAVWTYEGNHYDVCVENCDAPPATGT